MTRLVALECCTRRPSEDAVVMTTSNIVLRKWVDEVARLTQPESIHWCTGSAAERATFIDLMTRNGNLIKLNEITHPDSYLHRSHPSDVARVEHLTLICTRSREDAGPNNHWMAPSDAHRKIDALFAGAMRGRTLYVVPYCMGPIDSPYSRCGVEITDSPYVALSMQIMTRMGEPALRRIERDGTFVKGLHSVGDLDPDRRFIMHFPEENLIKSIGSGYGGNALLGKKCHALRIASWQARQEGWLAEHMLIMGVQRPSGEIHYLAGAFPSACGKTNLAMLVPPNSMPGWRIWTVGDDICWMHVGKDGRLYAINPEAGYFGVVPGTNRKTNRNAFEMIQHDTLFTNVALTADRQPWWEGLNGGVPVLDWQGRAWDRANGFAAHPNSRFTVAARHNPMYSQMAEAPQGVPISAILFGGRRRELAPLVYEARDWAHGVFVGASMASETTAAAEGQVGIARRDPMAMKPFCGYNFGDYWRHWLSFEARATQLPRVFHVNWFRQDRAGNYLWPGYSENLRVLDWIVKRCEGSVSARETPIGLLPHGQDIDIDGLEVDSAAMDALLAINPSAWEDELSAVEQHLKAFGAHLPPRLNEELETTRRRLATYSSQA